MDKNIDGNKKSCITETNTRSYSKFMCWLKEHNAAHSKKDKKTKSNAYASKYISIKPRAPVSQERRGANVRHRVAVPVQGHGGVPVGPVRRCSPSRLPGKRHLRSCREAVGSEGLIHPLLCSVGIVAAILEFKLCLSFDGPDLCSPFDAAEIRVDPVGVEGPQRWIATASAGWLIRL